MPTVRLPVVQILGRHWLIDDHKKIVGEAIKGGGSSPRWRLRVADPEEKRLVQQAYNTKLRWLQAINKASGACVASLKRFASDSELWSKRIDASAKACYNTAKRGSHIGSQRARANRARTWSDIYRNAHRGAASWHDRDPWDAYATNVASNIRKRFRDQGPGKAGSLATRRPTQETGYSPHPRRSAIPLLSDGSQTDTGDSRTRSRHPDLAGWPSDRCSQRWFLAFDCEPDERRADSR